MAIEFHSRGWNVTGCARSTESLNELSKQLVNSCFFQPVDITKATEVENFAQSVIQNVGVPDLLVNNAGMIKKTHDLLKFLQKSLLMLCQ